MNNFRKSKSKLTDSQYYNKLYDGGGFNNKIDNVSKVLDEISQILSWKKDANIIDIGCGEGVIVEALRQLGFVKSLGVDVSSVGIDKARRDFPNSKFICEDLSNWEPEEEVDVIFCRGMSWFHYELNTINRNGIDVPYETERFMSWLKLGGCFILQIATDFSGTDTKTRIRNNTLDDYLKLFIPLGRLVLLSDWKNNPVRPDKSPVSGIIIGIKKHERK